MTPRTAISRRRGALSTVSAVSAVVALGGGLTACSDAGDITCGEYADLDESGQRDRVSDLAEDSDNIDLDDYGTEERDDFLTSYAQFITSECEGQSDDTEVGDLVYEDT